MYRLQGNMVKFYKDLVYNLAFRVLIEYVSGTCHVANIWFIYLFSSTESKY
jgi:hypothetical protein